jgi:hypothetical protein
VPWLVPIVSRAASLASPRLTAPLVDAAGIVPLSMFPGASITRVSYVTIFYLNVQRSVDLTPTEQCWLFDEC